MSFSKTILKQLLITLLLIGLLLLLLLPLIKNWNQKRMIDQEIKDLEKQVSELENKNNNLKQVLDYMQSDDFVEREARTKLNYKKPGEEVAVIESRDGSTPVVSPNGSVFDLPAEPKPVGDPKILSNVAKWIKYFFNK